MSIQITIHGDNAAEVQSQLSQLLRGRSHDPQWVARPVEVKQTDDEPMQPDDAVEQLVAAAADVEPPPTEAAADLISFDEFKKRLNDVQGANGDNLRHITAILNEHGYAKVKEVKPEHYGSILAKCDELMAD